MAFGERLQEVRRRAGLTQEQFAEELNVSRQAVSRWESCRGYPEMEKLLYLCNRYGVTLNELFSEEVPTEAASPADPPRMAEPSLRAEVRNFISNLSLRSQLSGLAAVLSMALLIVLCARGLQGGSEGMDNVMTLVWTGAVILFGIAEGLTAGLVSIWFVFGALAALAAAFLNAGVGVQIAVFVIVSAVTLALTMLWGSAGVTLPERLPLPEDRPTVSDGLRKWNESLDSVMSGLNDFFDGLGQRPLPSQGGN